MTNNKKNIILTAVIVLLILSLIGGWFFWQKSKADKKIDAFDNKVFTLLDDKTKLVYSEELNLYLEAKTQYEKKIEEAKANIAEGGDKDFLVANYNNLALFSRYIGDYRQAYEAYINSLSTINDSRMTLMAFGELLQKMKAYNSAEFAFRRSAELNPWESASWLKLISLLKVIGDEKKIDEAYKSSLENTEKNVDATQYPIMLADYADWLISIKSYDQAINILEKLKTAQPDKAASIDKKIAEVKLLK